MSVSVVLFFKLFMWLSRDKCTGHTIYPPLCIVNDIMAASRKVFSNEMKEVVSSLYPSGLKIPCATITYVIGRFRKRGSVDNVPWKGKQANLDDRDTRKLLRSVIEKEVCWISLLCFIRVLSAVSKRTVQKILYKQGYFRIYCNKRFRIREVNRKTDYPGVEVQAQNCRQLPK